MKALRKLSLCVLFLTGCSYEHPSLQTLYNGYRAGRDVKNEKYEDALVKYYSLLEYDPLRAETHSNIGVLLGVLQKPEDALKSLKYALELAQKSGDARALFAVRFNLGVYYGGQNKYAEALENYQAALDVVPDSLETKTNIELLLQRQQQEQEGEGEKNESDPQSDNSSSQDQQPNEPSDQKNQGDQPDDKEDENNKQPQKKESSPKYKPRPFKGDQLSEGDVKKILGELGNQEQKIRANFDKKEKGKSEKNEKDW